MCTEYVCTYIGQDPVPQGDMYMQAASKRHTTSASGLVMEKHSCGSAAETKVLSFFLFFSFLPTRPEMIPSALGAELELSSVFLFSLFLILMVYPLLRDYGDR